MRIDRVPPLLAPLVALYGYAFGALLYAQYWIYHHTVRIRWSGTEQLVPGKNYIFVFWHGFFPCYFTAYQHHENHAWIVHPLVYVYPAWIFARLTGVTTAILGSAGHDGRSAADRLVLALRAGASTVIAPDGPSGPARELKLGVVHMAAQSGVEIVPLRFVPHPAVRTPGWDHKTYPVPFGRLTVEVGAPVNVGAVGVDAAAASLRRFMNAPDPTRLT